MASIVKSVNGAIFSRQFYQYNGDNACIEFISDDGSGLECDDLTNVTSRNIIEYVRTTTAPVGLALEESHYYLVL